MVLFVWDNRLYTVKFTDFTVHCDTSVIDRDYRLLIFIDFLGYLILFLKFHFQIENERNQFDKEIFMQRRYPKKYTNNK
jgi:hypothetical protein